MCMGAEKRSIWLLKWLQLQAYIPNLVGTREKREEPFTEEQIGFCRKDKWVFRRTNKR